MLACLPACLQRCCWGRGALGTGSVLQLPALPLCHGPWQSRRRHGCGRSHLGKPAICCRRLLTPYTNPCNATVGVQGLYLLLKPTGPSPCRPGPNAPLSWVRACVQVLDPKSKWRSKILLGLNLYGMDYSASRDAREPITGAR